MSLRLPFVYWNSPPEIHYTCVLISKKQDRIVAGSRGGNLILFYLKKVFFFFFFFKLKFEDK